MKKQICFICEEEITRRQKSAHIASTKIHTRKKCVRGRTWEELYHLYMAYKLKEGEKE